MIRAKFRCNNITFHGDPTNADTPRTYELTAIYDNTTPENQRFTRATPWGEMKIRIDNPAAQMNWGELYYFDITPCVVADAVINPEAMGNTHHVTGVYTPDVTTGDR